MRFTAYNKHVIKRGNPKEKEVAKMIKVKNEYGVEIDFEAAAMLMDDDIREQLHMEGFDNEQDFFDAYCKAHEEAFHDEFECAKENPVY